MNIKTYYNPPPIPSKGEFDWTAIDNDSYDGAPDSNTRHLIGYGITEQQAIDDLKEKLETQQEYSDAYDEMLYKLTDNRTECIKYIVNGLLALWIGVVVGMVICLIKYR